MHLRFTPKHKGEDTFEGDCWIHDTSYSVQKITLRPQEDANLNFVTGLALDGLGNLFAADYNLHIIAKITPARVASQFATTLGQPNGLAFDSAGNLYLANEGSGQINKYTPAGAGSIFASGQGSPNGLAFDGSLLYEGDFQNGAINKIAPDSSVLPFVTMSSGNASWIAFVPTPEPGSMVLLAIGGVWVFFQRRRLSNVSNSPTVAHKS